MRMMTNFTTKTHLPHHWHNIVGTKGAETAAPAIVAAQSIEQNSACLEVPDFRPGAKRQFGEPQGLGHTFKK